MVGPRRTGSREGATTVPTGPRSDPGSPAPEPPLLEAARVEVGVRGVEALAVAAGAIGTQADEPAPQQPRNELELGPERLVAPAQLAPGAAQGQPGQRPRRPVGVGDLLERAPLARGQPLVAAGQRGAREHL